MSFLSRLSAHVWLPALLCAVGFLAWADYGRAQRVAYVTNTDREDAVMDAASPTGYAGGQRWLLAPEHNNRSYQWIAETQQMLARREWRVRHIDYENAPFGREVHAASPYRWWLGLLAWADHSISGRPLGAAVEQAALWADPLLHLLFLVGTTIFARRWFGSFSAALLATGLVALFPFAGNLLPGAPDDRGLVAFLALWSVLPLLAGAGGHPSSPDAGRTRRLFLGAGIVGGLGLWVSAAGEAPLLAGIAAGGLLAAWLAAGGVKSKDAVAAALPWRAWSLGGSVTCLAAYLVEYFPGHLDFQLQVNHPLYGLAWLGTGELLTLAEAWFRQREKSFWIRRRTVALVLATGAVAVLPFALVRHGGPNWITGELSSSRLTSLPGGAVANSLFAWLSRDGLTASLGATCFPLLLAGPAGWRLARRRSETARRAACALAFGPALFALLLACGQLSWWSTCDVLLLALVAAATAEIRTGDGPPPRRGLWSALAALALLPGLIRLLPAAAGPNLEFTRLEVEGLIERSLAHWISAHAGPEGAVILVPPDRTTGLTFHGGLLGLGTADWENRDGLAATIRIVSATTAEEALSLLNQRGVTHLIIPSWDSDLDEFARLSLGKPEDSFIMAVHRWALPPWLKPLPYRLPEIAGFEGPTVLVLAVTQENNRATAASRVAEYFLETAQPELAGNAAEVLQRYPADLGAMVALAQVEKARGHSEAYAAVFTALLSSLTGGFDRTLPWDRRVSLAVVLAQGERNDLAREQVRRCLEKADAARLRSLTTGALFRLQVLGKAFGLSLPDPALRELAVKLLPTELRQRL